MVALVEDQTVAWVEHHMEVLHHPEYLNGMVDPVPLLLPETVAELQHGEPQVEERRRGEVVVPTVRPPAAGRLLGSRLAHRHLMEVRVEV